MFTETQLAAVVVILVGLVTQATIMTLLVVAVRDRKRR